MSLPHRNQSSHAKRWCPADGPTRGPAGSTSSPAHRVPPNSIAPVCQSAISRGCAMHLTGCRTSTGWSSSTAHHHSTDLRARPGQPATGFSSSLNPACSLSLRLIVHCAPQMNCASAQPKTCSLWALRLTACVRRRANTASASTNSRTCSGRW